MGATAIEGLRYSERRTEPPENMILTDQHGREWEAEIHIRTMTWVGPLILKNARPPVDIPPKYCEPVLGSNGRPISGKLYVNERRWLDDTKRRYAEWMDALRANAKRMFPNNYGEAVANPPMELLLETGPGPLDPRYMEAMIAGNKWALGLSTKRPSWVDQTMIDGAKALKRSSGWREDVSPTGEIDASLYPDADDEDVEPVVAAPVKRGPGRPRKEG